MFIGLIGCTSTPRSTGSGAAAPADAPHESGAYRSAAVAPTSLEPPNETHQALEDMIDAADLGDPDKAIPSGLNLPLSGVQIDSAGRIVPLPKLNSIEVNEMLSRLQLQLEIGHDYRTAPLPGLIHGLPSLPAEIVGSRQLWKPAKDGLLYARMGFRKYVAQSPDVYLYGVRVNAEGVPVAPNPDLEQIVAYISQALESSTDKKKELAALDLEFQVVQLSYNDAAGALPILNSLGVTTCADGATLKFPVRFEDLPIVVTLPELTKEHSSLLGGAQTQKGEFGSSVSLSEYTEFPASPNNVPDSRLLIYYHPAHPDQFSRVRKYLDEVVDRPARQVFVEGMVLEISEEGLEELGLEWEFQSGNFNWMLGSLSASELTRSLTGGFDTRNNFDTEFSAQITALIKEGKAEVLSRPSVLTVNNRQATIRVGTDVPIATSQEGISGDSNKLSFNFKYLPIGILLNIRPRVTEDGKSVSMLIDIVVSDEVQGEDLIMRDAEGRILASAPTVATRRVQTYAMIDNNTPFIIGGLVRKGDTFLEKKTPFLSDIPWVGKLFTATEQNNVKQEVIIVLTPYVIDDDRSLKSKPHLPKDEDQFDSFGNELFRDAYRIRAEDVFDLSFLRENKWLRYYIKVFRKAIESDFNLAEREPFRQLTKDGVTVEYILVERMIYDVIKRLSADANPEAQRLDSRIALDRLIYFQPQQTPGFRVAHLAETLRMLGDGDSPAGFFAANPGKAMAITYLGDEIAPNDALITGQAPTVAIIACRDADEWSRMLWELNQPDENGRDRSTLLLHSPEDLKRLRRAVLLHKIITLNGGKKAMDLNRFSVGRMLRIPEISPDQRHLINKKVAELFYHTEHYYPALSVQISSIIQGMKAAVDDPEFRLILESVDAQEKERRGP